jgi:hypothetical protein
VAVGQDLPILHIAAWAGFLTEQQQPPIVVRAEFDQQFLDRLGVLLAISPR